MIFKRHNVWRNVGYRFVRDDERWFAWYPIRLDGGDIAWLQYVTKSFHDGDGYGDSFSYKP